ncbi:MAG: eL32 family ribosomal protein [Nanobdellota archaeon]
MVKKKPSFIRQDYHKKSKLEKKWVRPRGIQSKQRLQKNGHSAIVKTGYRMPRDQRGTDRNGLYPVVVNNLGELDKVDPKENSVVLSSGLGNRKRSDLVRRAKEKNIALSNIKDPDAFLKQVEKKISDKKQERKNLEEKRKKQEQKKQEKSKEKTKEDSGKEGSEDKKDQTGQEKESASQKSSSQKDDQKKEGSGKTGSSQENKPAKKTAKKASGKTASKKASKKAASKSASSDKPDTSKNQAAKDNKE